MDHLPTEVLQQIIFEVINNSSSSSPQAELASFARTTRRISSIATPVLYRSIRIVDGHSAQLLVRTYLDGINPFTLARGMEFPRVQIESLHLDYPPPDVEHVKVTFRAAYPVNARIFSGYPATYQRRSPLPCLDVLADYGFLSNLTTILLSNFTDELDLVPLLFGPGRPLRQQVQRLGIVHNEDEDSTIRNSFVTSFILGLSACIDSGEYLLDCPVLTTAEIFAIDGRKNYLDPRDRLSTLPPAPPSPSVCRAALYDFNTFASVYAWRELARFNLRKSKIQSFRANIQFASLLSLRLRLGSQEYLPFVLNKTVLPNLKSLILLCELFFIRSELDILVFRRAISRLSERDCGTIKGPQSYGIDRMDKEAVFGVADISNDWPPLSEEQVGNFGDYQGQELDLLDLTSVYIYNGW
ncbi:hypothetical protein JCM5353_000217 [Sporobolomyces roseus]